VRPKEDTETTFEKETTTPLIALDRHYVHFRGRRVLISVKNHADWFVCSLHINHYYPMDVLVL
jgi:hypothetical protein